MTEQKPTYAIVDQRTIATDVYDKAMTLHLAGFKAVEQASDVYGAVVRREYDKLDAIYTNLETWAKMMHDFINVLQKLSYCIELSKANGDDEKEKHI